MKRHVIFLGAGASKSSGYPLADELRLRLSSQQQYESTLKKTLGDAYIGGEASRPVHEYFQYFRDTVELFRHGGFATVDEFSKLASSDYAEHVIKMKHLVQLALLLHNPEVRFYESDYYPFIQRLFKEDLYTLSEYVTLPSHRN